MRVLLTSRLDEETVLGRTLREHVEDLEVPGGAFVVLDPQCPLVPREFVADLTRRVQETGRPHVAVRPVTDTVKILQDGLVGRTVDRAGLRRLASPVVLPEDVPVPGTLAELVESLQDPVFVEAPPLARRVADASEIKLLEALARSF